MSFWNAACRKSDTLFEAALTSPVEPEHCAKPGLMPSSELYCQLRLANTTKSTEHEHLPSTVWTLRQKGMFELGNILGTVDELVQDRDTSKAERDVVFAKAFYK